MPASRMTQRQTAERRDQVLRSHAAGMSFEQIARTVPGVGSAKAAAQDYRRALAAASKLRGLAGDTGSGAVELELQRLEAATLAVETVMRTAAADPATHDRVLRAAGQLARLSDSRVSLLGLAMAPAQPGSGGGEDELAARRRRISARRAGGGR